MTRRLRALIHVAERLRRNEAGNFAILTAILLMVLVFALGMAYDLTMAQSRKDQINGMADVAALGAVTPTMMAQSASASQAQAAKLFSSQIATVSGVSYQAGNLDAVASDKNNGTTVSRTVTVDYTAGSVNVFAGVLGMQTFPISGSSSATASTAPNIDFHVMLDTSPSMEIAATTAGINTMVANTSSQGGCAFGCHEYNPGNTGNPNNEDNYTLARNLGVPMRIDLVNQATQNLMSTAQTTSSQDGAKYRAAIYTIDYNFNTLQPLTSNLSAAATAAANISSLEVYDQSCVTKTNCNNDEDSYLDTGLRSVNTAMPPPGNGTNNAGDKPQEVLFVVSDGVNDVSGGSSCGSGRTCAPIDTLGTDWCTTVKNRGIRIAFLYTTYNPLPTNSFYTSHIAPFQSQIATDAQNCASPGLFFQVNTNGDISGALTALFQKVVATARLTH
jgi:Flp pilus assembly protein TadG